MQVEFSSIVQRQADAAETEMTSAQLWSLFEATYLAGSRLLAAHGGNGDGVAGGAGGIVYHGHHLFETGEAQGIELDITLAGERRKLRGSGNGPIDATVHALGLPIRIDSYEERALAHGADASALAIVEAARDGTPKTRFGAGRHQNIATASVLAVLSAAERLEMEGTG
jgi:2-isopropylmalate synthase